MKDKLQPRDFRFISICLVLAAAATWFSFGNFYRAFPEAIPKGRPEQYDFFDKLSDNP